MKIIYVDDEKPAIENFRLTTENFPEIGTLHTFQRGEEAMEFVKENTVDVAFLDMEMPGIHGLELARAIKQYDAQIRVVFVTAFGSYALDAWGVDATGYLLKPYTADDIHKELAKCSYKPLPSHRVVIETIPTFSIRVDGMPLYISGSKPKEMLALLVDRGGHGFTTGECIALLWPEREADSGTQSLYRMTWKRLLETLKNAGIQDIVCKKENCRYLRTDKVDCDLYHILAGDKQAARKYNGEYLREYDWAEERNAQLYHMLMETAGMEPFAKKFTKTSQIAL